MRDRLISPKVRAAVAALVSVAVLVPASAAYGHASGVVPQARLRAEGPQVFMDWWAAADDITDIGVGLGLLREEASLAFRGVGDRYPSDEEVASFAGSAELESYLLDNVRVSQGGRPCDAEVTVPDEVIAEGVGFTFLCPQPVEQVSVRITLLHELDEEFRTYSVDGTIWSPVHTVHQPEHVWDATLVDTAAEADGWLLRWAGLGLVLAVGGAVLWWMRSDSRRREGGRWGG